MATPLCVRSGLLIALDAAPVAACACGVGFFVVGIFDVGFVAAAGAVLAAAPACFFVFVAGFVLAFVGVAFAEVVYGFFVVLVS